MYKKADNNKNTNFATEAITTANICLFFKNLKTKIKIKLENHIKGKKYAKKTVKGPKTNPLLKTPKLGKIAIGKKYFLGKDNANKNKHALTTVPTNHCGPPKTNGTKKETIEITAKNTFSKKVVFKDKLITASFSFSIFYL